MAYLSVAIQIIMRVCVAQLAPTIHRMRENDPHVAATAITQMGARPFYQRICRFCQEAWTDRKWGCCRLEEANEA